MCRVPFAKPNLVARPPPLRQGFQPPVRVSSRPLPIPGQPLGSLPEKAGPKPKLGGGGGRLLARFRLPVLPAPSRSLARGEPRAADMPSPGASPGAGASSWRPGQRSLRSAAVQAGAARVGLPRSSLLRGQDCSGRSTSGKRRRRWLPRPSLPANDFQFTCKRRRGLERRRRRVVLIGSRSAPRPARAGLTRASLRPWGSAPSARPAAAQLSSGLQALRHLSPHPHPGRGEGAAGGPGEPRSSSLPALTWEPVLESAQRSP